MVCATRFQCSCNCNAPPHSQCNPSHTGQVPLTLNALCNWNVLSGVDDMHLHLLVVLETRQKFGGDEEVLTRVLLACNVHHALVYHAFVAGIHTLVDFVDDAEG